MGQYIVKTKNKFRVCWNLYVKDAIKTAKKLKPSKKRT